MHRRRGGRDGHGDRGEEGFGTAPVVGERARRWSAFVGAAGDSERHVVAVEEVELPVMARALDIATFAERVVVAPDLSEVLCVEDDGEVVEDLGEATPRERAEGGGASAREAPAAGRSARGTSATARRAFRLIARPETGSGDPIRFNLLGTGAVSQHPRTRLRAYGVSGRDRLLNPGEPVQPTGEGLSRCGRKNVVRATYTCKLCSTSSRTVERRQHRNRS